jgi:PAS domain S-box-containing protein
MGLPYQELLQAAGYGLFVVAPDHRITATCPKIEAMWGWTLADVSAANGHDVFHHSHQDGSPYSAEECPILKALLTGETYHIANDAFLTKTGRYLSVEYMTTPIISHERIAAVIVLARAIDEIPAVVPMPPDILSTHEVVWRSGGGGLCTWVSEGWRALTGLSFDASLGYGYLQAVPPDDHDKVRRAWEVAWPAREPFWAHHRLLRWDGSVVRVECAAQPYSDRGGQLLGYVGYVKELDVRLLAHDPQTGSMTMVLGCWWEALTEALAMLVH